MWVCEKCGNVTPMANVQVELAHISQDSVQVKVFVDGKEITKQPVWLYSGGTLNVEKPEISIDKEVDKAELTLREILKLAKEWGDSC